MLPHCARFFLFLVTVSSRLSLCHLHFGSPRLVTSPHSIGFLRCDVLVGATINQEQISQSAPNAGDTKPAPTKTNHRHAPCSATHCPALTHHGPTSPRQCPRRGWSAANPEARRAAPGPARHRPGLHVVKATTRLAAGCMRPAGPVEQPSVATSSPTMLPPGQHYKSDTDAL